MTREDYLKAVECVEGIRDEEGIINTMEEMESCCSYLELICIKNRELSITLDNKDLITLIKYHKERKAKYENNFKAI